jgi:ketosteroid isomerase-like protein
VIPVLLVAQTDSDRHRRKDTLRMESSTIGGRFGPVAKPVSPDLLDRLQVQERFECFNRGEFDMMIEPYAEDAVFDVSNVFTDLVPVQGHDALRRSWHQLRETWSELRLDPGELLDLGDNRYVLDLRLWGKGQSSGAAVDQRFAFLYTVRGEKIARAELFADVDAAVAAAESVT